MPPNTSNRGPRYFETRMPLCAFLGQSTSDPIRLGYKVAKLAHDDHPCPFEFDLDCYSNPLVLLVCYSPLNPFHSLDYSTLFQFQLF